ncbi:hypothetical protein CNR22_00675 [Sphingobacteriaceae bacterium]|nr:hypothetical protein CNR22_00675 [Sphingobacteriaceae bacterium]
MQKDLSVTLLLLSQCVEACDNFNETIALRSDIPKLNRLIGLCSDCSEFCSLTSDFLQRESSISKKMLRFCSEVCHKFADELTKNPQVDGDKNCYKACRSCAEQCALIG